MPTATRSFALIALCALLAACAGDGAGGTTASDDTAPVEESAAFYVGQWAADPVWCTDQTEGFPITITADRFEGRENSCAMETIADTPEGGWRADLVCVAEGATNAETIVLSPVGDQLAIAWPERAAEATLFSRCL